MSASTRIQTKSALDLLIDHCRLHRLKQETLRQQEAFLSEKIQREKIEKRQKEIEKIRAEERMAFFEAQLEYQAQYSQFKTEVNQIEKAVGEPLRDQTLILDEAKINSKNHKNNIFKEIKDRNGLERDSKGHNYVNINDQ